MVTKREIQELIEPFLSREDANSKVDQCGRLSNMAALELQENGIQAKRVDGKVKGNSELDHSFVIVPVSEVSNVSEGPLIVDPTAEQFADETRTDAQWGSVEKFNAVEVFEPSNRLYKMYKW